MTPVPRVVCRSGFLTVTFLSPGVAEVVLSDIETFSTGWAAGFGGSTSVGAKLTVTPPVTVTRRWLAYPGPPVSGPGSKNSDPATGLSAVPVNVTVAAVDPWHNTA
jgi:hypothetical protein